MADDPIDELRKFAIDLTLAGATEDAAKVVKFGKALEQSIEKYPPESS